MKDDIITERLPFLTEDEAHVIRLDWMQCPDDWDTYFHNVTVTSHGDPDGETGWHSYWRRYAAVVMVEQTVTLPVYWASALINGDDSSFDIMDDEDAEKERRLLDSTMTSLFGNLRYEFTDVGEPHFSRNYHHYVEGDISPVTGGDVAEYAVTVGLAR